jgi:hypothetical protein
VGSCSEPVEAAQDDLAERDQAVQWDRKTRPLAGARTERRIPAEDLMDERFAADD